MQSIKRESAMILTLPLLTHIRDYHKLTYYYYAEAYVNFNELVTDLFKQYKVRIWMSAVNPASVVNPAGIMNVQPPSAIGPGAILHSNAGRSRGVGFGFGNNPRIPTQYGKPEQAPLLCLRLIYC